MTNPTDAASDAETPVMIVGAGPVGLMSAILLARQKIAAVRRGSHAESLLDTYQSERRPVALANTAQSLVNNRQVSRLFESVRGAKRGEPPRSPAFAGCGAPGAHEGHRAPSRRLPFLLDRRNRA
jgi:hypothetical protein